VARSYVVECEMVFFGDGGDWKPSPWCTEEGLDLARRMLAVTPSARLTLSEALHHPFLRLE
jgi:serine/threonine protein kinase